MTAVRIPELCIKLICVLPWYRSQRVHCGAPKHFMRAIPVPACSVFPSSQRHPQAQLLEAHPQAAHRARGHAHGGGRAAAALSVHDHELAQADDSPPEVVERWLLEVPLSTASGGEGVGAPYEAATDLHRVWASLALTDYYYMYSVLQVESTLVCTRVRALSR